MLAFNNLGSDLQIWESASAQPVVYAPYTQQPAFPNLVTPAWMRLVMNPQASADVDSISKTVEAVFEALSVADPSSLNLAGLNANCVQGEHLAAVLRATYKWRSVVPGWEQSLAVAEEALRLQGADAHDALFGLLPK